MVHRDKQHVLVFGQTQESGADERSAPEVKDACVFRRGSSFDREPLLCRLQSTQVCFWESDRLSRQHALERNAVLVHSAGPQDLVTADDLRQGPLQCVAIQATHQPES